ncbi:hypothetical protein IHQ56_10695 [Methylobacillus flagellatus]|uniref:hypothetical protein n=1 Tax=Methylobacillus flagellatus TaxID=405 RepID=UPI0028539D41|nr:hypothetical protein [Methylobacillus flagellatus]MDR5172287.1 hypothetical protein [Methylobacillus flagellatus]
MKLDQEDKEFFQRRARKETPHGLIAFILASIVVSGGLYMLYQNRHSKPTAQEESSISQADQPRSAREHPPQPTYKDQLAYQPKPEPVYAPHPSKPTVYKCKHPDGSTMYSESPCSTGATTQIVSVQENVIDSSALRNKANQMRAMAVRGDTEVLRVSDVRYMSEVEVWRRIKELEMDLQSITATPEKMSAARTEINVLKNRKVRELSYEDENERAGLRRLLNSNDKEIREKSLRGLLRIYQKYS